MRKSWTFSRTMMDNVQSWVQIGTWCGSLSTSMLYITSMKFLYIVEFFVDCAIANRSHVFSLRPWAHVRPGWACLRPILGLCWPYVSPSLAYVGPVLALCWPMLAPCWPILWPMLRLCWRYVRPSLLKDLQDVHFSFQDLSAEPKTT